MGRVTKPLTDREIKQAKPKDKPYKKTDGGGLYILINPNGSKLWRYKYRIGGKEKSISLGAYPTISLSEARRNRAELKKQISNNIDPAQERKKKKEQLKEEITLKQNTFYKVSQKWLESYKTEVSEDYHTKLHRRFINHIYPHIKNKPIKEINRKDIIKLIESIDIEKRETANRTLMLLNKVFMYAVTHEYVEHNIIADIDKRVLLGKKIEKHYPALTKPKDIRGYLLSVDSFNGVYTTKKALELIPYLFVRSSNLRYMQWCEINFETKEWIIPANKMKMKKEFILPLPKQAIKILTDLKKKALSNDYVFPSSIYSNRPFSENTLISALRRMGYTKDELVIHSFRQTFSTIAHENMDKHGFSSEIIEALLAHEDTNKVRRAYNQATYKKQKRELIQWYANYLDEIKAQSDF